MQNEDLKSKLNDEQIAAVTAPDGPVLVIAAAGTGKTRTLTHRVAWLVRRGIPADRILLLTFTNRAAGEMLERARAIAGDAVGGLWGGTFHHMGNRLLRRHAPLLGYGTDYTILDRDDSEKIVKHAIQDLGLKDKRFPKASVLMGLFSLAVNKAHPLEDLAVERFDGHEVSPDDVLRVHAEYEKRKRALNGMDFDDLLLNALILFREHEPICARYREQFEHVLVDEYQDTNAIQGDWVDLLAQGSRNLFVVGDDFQSIYSWRGANFRNIITFPERYEDARVYKLETNYRSTPEVLSVANACIAGNPEQFQKTLHAVRPSLQKPTLLRCGCGYEQAQYVIEAIQNLLREGYAPNDIAVLYRAHYHAMEMQLELNRSSLTYSITSGIRFFEQAHVKDVCTVARLAANPADELAFHRMLGLLPGVGDKTSARIWKKLEYQFELWDPDHLVLLRAALPPKARPSWDGIRSALESCKRIEALEQPNKLLAAFVDQFYDEFAVETFDNYRTRKEDLNGLIAFSANYTGTQQFLHDMALQTNLDEPLDQPQETCPGQAIRLSTIHQAKGLEWPVVFILWMVEGMFPNLRSSEEEGGLAEERRLFYVAVTRAKDQLFLCQPAMRRARDGSINYCMISQFVSELPDGLLRRTRM